MSAHKGAMHKPRRPCSARLPALGLWLFSVVCAAALVPLASAGCKSDYCSLGKLGPPFYGDIATGAGLRKALEATSYKKELVTVTLSKHSRVHLDGVLQMWNEMKTMHSIAHLLVLGGSESSCERLRHYATDLGCAWDTTDFKTATGQQYHFFGDSSDYLWHLRQRVIVRGGRMGYNMMSLDADVIWFHDPYPYLNAPPLDKLNAICGAESDTGCNGGLQYVRSTKPDGAATWIWKDVIETPLRMMDDDLAYIKATFNKTHLCATFDQAFLDDSVAAAMMGKPTHWNAVWACWDENKIHGYKREEVVPRIRKLSYEAKVKKEDFSPPPAWGPMMRGGFANGMRHADIRVPNNGGAELPWELGGRLYSPVPGKLSKRLYEQFKEDCPDCPLWPEEKAEDEPKAAALVEKWGIPPSWFYGGGGLLSQHGFWSAHPGDLVRQVLGHIHNVPGYAPMRGLGTKVGFRKFANHYNWSLGQMVHGKSLLHQNEDHKGSTAFHSLHVIQKVVALHPSIPLEKLTRNPEEFRRIVAGLMLVGMASGRTVLLPDIPCEACWAHENGCNCTAGFVGGRMSHFTLPAMRNGFKTFKFTPAFYLSDACLHFNPPANGMFSVEYDHWLTELSSAQRTAAEPTAANSVFESGPSLAQMLAIPTSDVNAWMVSLPWADVETHMQKYQDQPVVYLRHPVSVTMDTMPAPKVQHVYKATEECPIFHRGHGENQRAVISLTFKHGRILPGGQVEALGALPQRREM